ncbi:MAG: 50S ribosomal protein L32 [Kiritimatiellia bacterium]|jgi:large subunit ribosomal protein L32|nr:50S ribosomal protein L32 [Kiritimatiellia bacterium]MDP6848418.1 50S ribosomal protein L32 [Kiritimatiellia bacterium]
MAVPKRKTSKSKSRSRKRSHSKPLAAAGPCSECGAPKELHRVCPSCGYYDGKQVMNVEAD